MTYAWELWALVAASATAAQPTLEEFGTGAVLPPPQLYDASPRQPLFRSAVPPRTDLSRFAPPPGRQGGQSSCTAWATTYAARTILAAVETGGAAPKMFSPAFVFNHGKRLQAERFNHPLHCKAGLMIPIALEVLETSGTLPLAEFPYDPASCDRLPTPTDQVAAASSKIKSWATLADRDAVRQALAQSRPVVFSMVFAPEFFKLKGSATFNNTARGAPDTLHAMTIVGYDDERDSGKGAFRVINSWGDQWGDKGFFWLSYDAFDSLSTYDGRLQAYAVIPRQSEVLAETPPLTLDPEAALAAIRAGLSCGDISWRRQDGVFKISGYVGSAEEKSRIIRDIQKVVPGASVALDELKWPQCEIKRRLSRFDGGVTLNLVGAASPSDAAGVKQLRAGEFFSLAADVQPATPNLTIVYVQADGTAVPLYAGQPAASADGLRRITLGAGSRKYRVMAPFGPEAIVAIASDQPLLTSLSARGLVERKFIDLLNRELAAAAAAGRPVKVASLLLRTAPAN